MRRVGTTLLSACQKVPATAHLPQHLLSAAGAASGAPVRRPRWPELQALASFRRTYLRANNSRNQDPKSSYFPRNERKLAVIPRLQAYMFVMLQAAAASLTDNVVKAPELQVIASFRRTYLRANSSMNHDPTSSYVRLTTCNVQRHVDNVQTRSSAQSSSAHIAGHDVDLSAWVTAAVVSKVPSNLEGRRSVSFRIWCFDSLTWHALKETGVNVHITGRYNGNMLVDCAFLINCQQIT